jgi:hypothetical protein
MEDIERKVIQHEEALHGSGGIVPRVAELEAWKNSYLQSERAASCIGCDALDQYKIDQAKRDEEAGEMVKGKMSLRGVYFMGIIQMVGIVATFLASMWLKK